MDLWRCFTAIKMPDDFIQDWHQIWQTKLVHHHQSAIQWTRPEALHVTLNFMGMIASDKIRLIMSTMNAECRVRPAFDLQTSRLGQLPLQGRPRVLILTLANRHRRQLTSLQAGLEAAFCRLGLSFEDRPYDPHITLARLPAAGPSPPSWAAESPDLPSLFARTLPVREVILFRSRSTADGSRYEAMGASPLSGSF